MTHIAHFSKTWAVYKERGFNLKVTSNLVVRKLHTHAALHTPAAPTESSNCDCKRAAGQSSASHTLSRHKYISTITS